MIKPDILTEVRVLCTISWLWPLPPATPAVCVADLLDGQRFSDIGVSWVCLSCLRRMSNSGKMCHLRD